LHCFKERVSLQYSFKWSQREKEKQDYSPLCSDLLWFKSLQPTVNADNCNIFQMREKEEPSFSKFEEWDQELFSRLFWSSLNHHHLVLLFTFLEFIWSLFQESLDGEHCLNQNQSVLTNQQSFKQRFITLEYQVILVFRVIFKHNLEYLNILNLFPLRFLWWDFQLFSNFLSISNTNYWFILGQIVNWEILD